ncbi:MAG: hypothetical protein FWF70_03995, partial [Bacteroidetes bacterium]|nr:hypothetical protein [Bacteroidota bacterium]
RDNEAQYHFKYEEQEIERIIKRVKNDNKENLAGKFRNVKSMLQTLSEEQFNNLAKQLAYPRGQRINNQTTYQTYLKAKKLNDLMHSLGKNNLDLLGLDLNTVKNFFVNNLNKSSGRYLKTPSIIVTFNDMMTTGGHNLSSKISRVNSLQNYKRDSSGERETVSGERKPTTTANQPQTAKPKTTTSTATAPKPATQPNIRPRTEVIAGGERAHRGF